MSKYSSEEKKAYYVGMGYAMAMDGLRYDETTSYMSDRMRGSFYAGHQAYDNLGRKFGPEKLAPSKKPAAKKPAKKTAAKKPSAKKPAKKSSTRDLYDDFEWGPSGIRGSYTVDGFFEPD